MQEREKFYLNLRRFKTTVHQSKLLTICLLKLEFKHLKQHSLSRFSPNGNHAPTAVNQFFQTTYNVLTVATNLKKATSEETVNSFKWDTLIAHSHWVTFTFCRKSLRVCSRCLGVVIGFTVFFVLTIILPLQFFTNLQLHFQILFCISLALPAIFDWVTQTWNLRESNNKIRFFTGFLEAGGTVFLWLTPILLWGKIFILMIVLGIALNTGYLWKKNNR